MMNNIIPESNKNISFIRNRNTSFNNDFISPRRPVIHNIIQRLKSPLKRSRSTSTTTTRPLSALQQFIDNLVITNGLSIERNLTLVSPYNTNPTRLQIASYGPAVTAALQKNTDKLQALFEAGIALNPYDSTSKEFLVHTVCNNVNLAALKLMIQYSGPEIVQCVDSFGRTPLHNVCWNDEKVVSAERLEIMKTLIMCDPHIVYMKDCNGAEPFSYVQENQHDQWISFLNDNKHVIWSSHKEDTGTNRPVPILQTIEIVEMLALGRMDPLEVEFLHYDDECYESTTDGSDQESNDIEVAGTDFTCTLWDDENDDKNEEDSTSTADELADILSSITRIVNKQF